MNAHISSQSARALPAFSNNDELCHDTGGITWNIESSGTGPICLLLHGTGSSLHSWRPIMPMLAEHFRVIAIDLPGHANTITPAGADYSLPGMALAINQFLDENHLLPEIGVGHSAGAALLAQMDLQRKQKLGRIVSINGALVPLKGMASVVFSPIARAAVSSDFLGSVFAHRLRNPYLVEKLLSNTGSRISQESQQTYQSLCNDSKHVAGALRMMANWELHRLYPKLSQLQTPVQLIAASNDRMISLRDAYQLRNKLPNASLHIVPRLGHLAHEENPKLIADLIINGAMP